MRDVKRLCLKAGMQVLHASGGDKLMAPWTEGVGLVFMLHQVRPDPAEDFDPNRILRINPDFLHSILQLVRNSGLDIVSLDEMHRRMTEGDFSRRFVCFTLDDGYRDNKEIAYPIFKEHDAPFTIYVPANYPDGDGVLWWQALQDIIAKETRISVERDGLCSEFITSDDAQKWAAFDDIYWWLRSKEPDEQIRFIASLSRAYDFDLRAQCQNLIMSWDEIRELNEDPLVTIGAHTMSHGTLSKLSTDSLEADTARSIARLEKELGQAPEHMSYPYGDAASAGPREFSVMKDFGFKTAVTTRKGVLFAEHSQHLTALPRVSLNGDFQSEAFVSLYLTGAVFGLWNRFRRVNVA